MDELAKTAGSGFLTGADPLTYFMFFVIVSLITALGVLYNRNQKMSDELVSLVKEGYEFTGRVVTLISVLTEKVENAIRSKN